MMTCPKCGHGDIFSVIEVIEQRSTIRCTKDNYAFIEVDATLSHDWDLVTCSACQYAFDEYAGREAWEAAHGTSPEEPATDSDPQAFLASWHQGEADGHWSSPHGCHDQCPVCASAQEEHTP